MAHQTRMVALGCTAAAACLAAPYAQAAREAGMESSDYYYQFPGTPRITVSSHGNIVNFQTSGGAGGGGHISTEGYVLCYGGAAAYDRGLAEVGFGPLLSIRCAGNSCTFTRNTVDNVLELQQVLTKNSNEERSINVQMTVRNLRGSTVSNVILRRHADIDVDAYGSGSGSVINWFGASEVDSIFAWNAANNHVGVDSAMLMRHLSRSPMSFTYSPKVTSYFADMSCSPPNIAVDNPVRGDYAATLQYNIGTLLPGGSATVKLQYQRN
jgi:hypothetical protein